MKQEGSQLLEEEKEIPNDNECPENRIVIANYLTDGKKLKENIG